MNKIQMSRRQLLKATGLAGGSLIVGFSLPGCASRFPKGVAEDSLRPNAWVEVTADNRVILTLDRVEMGQGTYTGMATLVAEELDVPPQKIEVVFAPVADHYKQADFGMQITGGSTSLSSNWERLRTASASVREMLESAAAQGWQIPLAEVTTEDGYCINRLSGSRLSYGELVAVAATLKVPAKPKLKTASEFKYIGKHNQRLDAAPKVFGTATYGIDVELPGMLYAVLSRPPMPGGKVRHYDASAAQAMPGVKAVIQTNQGIAVVADSYWRARKAQGALKIDWAPGKIGTPSTEDVFNLYRRAADEETGSAVRSEGSFANARSASAKVVEVEYQAPFLAHATMEPQNCTAHVTDDFCEVWAPTQGPDIARYVASRESGLSVDRIKINTTVIGGGFGRRLSQDYVAEAVAVSRQVKAPVKVIWSREEDIQHDVYRPASYHRLGATFDENGKVTGWKHQIVCPRILDHFARDAAGVIAPSWTPHFMVKAAASMAPLINPDPSPYEGASDLPYAIPNIDVRHVQADSGIPVAYWRAVGHSTNGFVVEGFIDELAHEAGKDPFEFRDELLADQPRHRKVLRTAAERAGWGKPKAPGVVQGIACHQSFNSYVAQVVDLVVENNQIKVKRVVCAVDCGTVVNPDMVAAQMEGGILFGLSAALYGDITFKDGQVQQSNYHDYPVVRMNETPEIEVVIVESDESPTGVGEPGLPPLAPAVANAVFAATGKRLRQLPLRLA